MMFMSNCLGLFFFFNDTATTEIYTLSLHDALPITCWSSAVPCAAAPSKRATATRDRKSTRLNPSHITISYAVFCLKKKKKYHKQGISKKKKKKQNKQHKLKHKT